MVEDTRTLSATGMSAKESSFSDHLWRYSQGMTPSEGVKARHCPVASENLTNNQA